MLKNNVKPKRPSQCGPSGWSVLIHQLGNNIEIGAMGPPLPMLHLVTSQTLSLGTVDMGMQRGAETRVSQKELLTPP